MMEFQKEGLKYCQSYSKQIINIENNELIANIIVEFLFISWNFLMHNNMLFFKLLKSEVCMSVLRNNPDRLSAKLMKHILE